MPPKRPISPSAPSTSTNASKNDDDPLYISKSIEDRSSTFIAYFSPTLPQRQLQSHPDLKTASHRILAWRKVSTQKTLSGAPNYNTGFDDDGESYAGKKLLKLLDDYKVEGSLVVGRWYGGVLLGPVRFTHIENVAKEVIRMHLDEEKERNVKKVKLDEEEQRTLLIEELQTRDESIMVLRGLLEEKSGTKKKQEEKASTDTNGGAKPAVKLPDYDTMPLDRLKQLDKARDNTIAFLLKKIEEVEAKEEKEKKLSDAGSQEEDPAKEPKINNT